MKEQFEIFKKYLGGKEENTLTNDEAAMFSALIWASKSKDPSTQVGCAIVNERGREVSTGYNGAPNGWDDDDFPWKNNTGDDIKNKRTKNSKYTYVIHAEMNAIMNYEGQLKDLRGATLYVTLFPCTNCAKLIAQAGIKRIVYLDDRPKEIDNRCSKHLLKKAGVEYISFFDLKKVEEATIDLDKNMEKHKLKIKRPNETKNDLNN